MSTLCHRMTSIRHPSPAVRPPWSRADAAGPDLRGEALQIFTTIFICPAMELRSPIRRIAGAVAGAGASLRSHYLPEERTASDLSAPR